MLPTISARDERDEVLYCSPPLLARRSATPPAPRQRSGAITRATPAFLDPSRGYDLRARLIERGYSLSSVARSIDVSPSAVSRVLSGRRRSRKIERRISQILGIRKEDLFHRSADPDSRSQIVTCAA